MSRASRTAGTDRPRRPRHRRSLFRQGRRRRGQAARRREGLHRSPGRASPEPRSHRPGVVRAITAAGGRFRFSAKDLTFTALDGLPARRPGLLIASSDWLRAGLDADLGQTRSPFVSRSDPVKGAEWTLTLPRDDVAIRGRAARARWPPARRRGRPADWPLRALEEGFERIPGEDRSRSPCISCRRITTRASTR